PFDAGQTHRLHGYGFQNRHPALANRGRDAELVLTAGGPPWFAPRARNGQRLHCAHPVAFLPAVTPVTMTTRELRDGHSSAIRIISPSSGVPHTHFVSL